MPDHEANDIVLRNSSSAQITIDPISGASGALDFSTRALGRLILAGIDANSFIWAMTVGRSIECAEKGLEKFSQALQYAPAKSGYNKMLWFGFGIQSPLQVLTTSEAGSQFAAMCASLAELYSNPMAARIMFAYCKILVQKSPALQEASLSIPPSPSLQQMHLFVEKCAGIFSATEFPLRAERFMAFDGQAFIGQYLWPPNRKQMWNSRAPSDPNRIAEALYGVSQLARGTLRELTLAGVTDIGAVAAIAEWLFDLTIAIYSEEGEAGVELRYTNVSNEVEPQLTIIYTRKEDTAYIVERRRTTPLSNPAMLFTPHEEIDSSQDRVLGGRVHWDHALESTFGASWIKLRAMEEDLGTAIGSAASIFTSLVEGDNNIPHEWRYCNTIYFPDSFGQNFLSFGTHLFPELQSEGLQSYMIRSVTQRPFEEAKAEFETAIDRLRDVCGCTKCNSVQVQPSDARGSAKLDTRFCFPATTIAIIWLIRALSGMNMSKGLHPKRSGLEYVYKLIMVRLSYIRGHTRANNSSWNATRAMMQAPMKGARKALEASLLRFAQYIFCGRTFQDEIDDPKHSAIESNGICCFLDILRTPHTGDPTTLTRVNVIPGHIHWEWRVYNTLREKSTALFAADRHQLSDADGCFPIRVRQALESTDGATLQLLVTESIVPGQTFGLSAYYEVQVMGIEKYRIAPAQAVLDLCRGMGMMACPLENEQSLQETAQHLSTELTKESPASSYRQINFRGSNVTIVHGDLIRMLIAVHGCSLPLIQLNQCYTCCVHLTTTHPKWKNLAIIQTPSSNQELFHGEVEIEDNDSSPDQS